MCDFVNTTFCRLCLNITEGQRAEDLAGDQQLCTILESVFPGMKLDLIPTPKICLTCKDKLQFAYNFKNTVLCNEQKIESNKDCFINAIDTCRLCLKEKLGTDVVYFSENNHCSYSYHLIRTITEIATAPLNFDNFKKPIMCTQCWSSVKGTYGFKKRCFDNEERLRNLSKKTNNSLSTKEVLTAIILKEKALIRTSDKENKTLNMHSVVNLDSDNEHIVSKDIQTSLTCSTNKNPVLISDSNFDDLPDSKNKDEPSDTECSEDIFDEEINDDVVEIRIRKLQNADDTTLNNIDLNNRDIVMDAEQSKTHHFLGKLKEELVKDEMSFEEHNVDYQGFSFDDESKSSIRTTSPVALSENHSVKLETTDHNTLSIPSNKMIKLKKSLTVHLIDCVKDQSESNKTTITTENEKNRHPNVELRTINPPKRTIKCGECDFVTSSKDIMTRHMEKHILYSDTGNKCPNCQKVYRNPDILEEHIRSCETSLRKKVSLKKFSKTAPQTFKRVNKEKRGNIQLGDNIKPNETTDCDQNKAEAPEPASDMEETSLEALKKLVYQCISCSYNTACHSKYMSHLNKVHRKKFICDICQTGYKESGALERHRLTHCKDNKFVCDVCQKEFKRKVFLSKHLLLHRTDRNYICDICDKAFKTNYVLKFHRLTHFEEKKFVCDVCQKRFKTNHHLYAHKVMMHRDSLNLPCRVCQKVFKTKTGLRRHQVVHREVKNYICHICQKGFKYQVILTNHIKTHSSERNFVCYHCQKSFKTKDGLRGHIKVTHSTDRNCICDICEKAFKTNKHLKRHQLTHRTDRNYICDICEQAYKSYQGLRLHRLTHCEGNKFVCDVCQKEFKRKDLLSRHQWLLHRPDRNYICDICDKAFKTNYVLKFHRLTHFEEKKIVCDVCQKRFKTNHHLYEHKVMHRESLNLPCRVCQKVFKTKAGLRKHQVVHRDVKNYICHICQKGFKYQVILTNHIKTHCSERNFVCYHCQKTFKTKDGLRGHIKVTHSTDRNCICDICEKAFKTNNYLKHHQLTHFEERKFLCDVCQKGFKTNIVLKKHKKTHCSS